MCVSVTHLRWVTKLSYLFYADDLVPICETKTGIQSCLDNLQSYCQKWKLTFNNNKAKILVVEKRQSAALIHRSSAEKVPVEICKLYPYLGTITTNNENFKETIEELCKSSRRAIDTM